MIALLRRGRLEREARMSHPWAGPGAGKTVGARSAFSDCSKKELSHLLGSVIAVRCISARDGGPRARHRTGALPRRGWRAAQGAVGLLLTYQGAAAAWRGSLERAGLVRLPRPGDRPMRLHHLGVIRTNRSPTAWVMP